MTDYASKAASVRETLAKKGGFFTVKVYEDVAYDEDVSQTARKHTINSVPGCLLALSRTDGLVTKIGTEIEQDDKRILLASDVDVSKGECVILVNSEWFRVVGILDEIKPDGETVIMYDLHVRK